MSVASDTTEVLFPWNDVEFQANPYPWYERARRVAPVHHAPDGTYVVTRYDDTMSFGHLPVMSIVEPEVEGGERHPWRVFENTVLWLDPPAHTRMRRMTNRWFTPKLITEYLETTRASLGAILDGLETGQVVDAHFDIGVRPTHDTMCRILDMPEGDVEGMFWALWDAMLAHSSDPVEGTREKAIAGLEYMFAQTERLLAEKKQNPGNGLADELLAAHERGELTWREALETAVNLHMSGGPNPAYVIGSGLKLFADRPDLMAAYREKPETRRKFVDELTRMYPVELIITRFPTEDIEIRGVKIPAGSCVKFPIGAANRDPEVFDNPDEFDYERPNEASRNLTFSLGPHTCAGKAVSLAQIEVVLSMVADRYSRVELAGDPIEIRTDRLVIFDKLPVILH
ncbi:cytochrome P450 [Nocardia vaccinii]|uniref:cytochrome P450 n=1 Tax=Nocardia vaccinii TaxID=1822 RepID=UPI00082C5142|nr:cytochrome P450 [Nocardia vaccinii]